MTVLAVWFTYKALNRGNSMMKMTFILLGIGLVFGCLGILGAPPTPAA